MHKDLRRIVKALNDQGFETTLSKKGHVIVRQGDAVVAVFAGTPSDQRSWLNAIADCRKVGFQWPPPPRKGNTAPTP